MKPGPQQKPLNLLLADDDQDDRYFFDKALGKLSLETHLTTVSDGEQLMKYLFKNSRQLPDVLFLDFNLPRKNGLECLTEIKHDKKLKEMPVIIYATAHYAELVDKLYKTGAHYFLPKSDFPELRQYIHKVLTLLAKNSAQPTRDKFIVHLEDV